MNKTKMNKTAKNNYWKGILILLPLLVVIMCFSPTAEAAMLKMREVASNKETFEEFSEISVRSIGKIIDYRPKNRKVLATLAKKSLSLNDLAIFVNILQFDKNSYTLLEVPKIKEFCQLQKIQEFVSLPPIVNLNTSVRSFSSSILKKIFFLKGGLLPMAMGNGIFFFQTMKMVADMFLNKKKNKDKKGDDFFNFSTPQKETIFKMPQTGFVGALIILVLFLKGEKRKLPKPLQQTLDSVFPVKKATLQEWAVVHLQKSFDFLLKYPHYIALIFIVFRFRKVIWNLSQSSDARTEAVTKAHEFIKIQQKEVTSLVTKFNKYQQEWTDKFYKTSQVLTGHELQKLDEANKTIELLRTNIDLKREVIHTLEKNLLNNNHQCELEEKALRLSSKQIYDYLTELYRNNPNIKDEKQLDIMKPNLHHPMKQLAITTGKEIEKELLREKK